MDGWKKYFADGTLYDGSDHLVSSHLASWTKSRNTDIIKVESQINNDKICILGPGEYWQSDDLISSFQFGPSPGIIQKRRIMKLIDRNDKFIHIQSSANPRLLMATFTNEFKVPMRDIALSDSSIGQWFVLELNAVTSTFCYYFSSVKI